jgi:ABC-type nitrate/sulfonate/bicarbonate transport system permease component
MSTATQSIERHRVALRRRWMPDWIRWSSVVAFFVLWQGVSAYNEARHLFNPVFLPSPTRVIAAGVALYQQGLLQQDILQSTARLLAGFGCGVVSGVLLGILMARSKRLTSVLDPIINLVGPIPPFALLPMFIIWFGVGELPKVLFVAYATFLPILAYTVDGFRSVNPLLIRSALSLGATEAHVFRRVMLKSALSNIFVGMRIALALCFGALVVAEMVGADAGLGYLIIDSRNFFRMDNMMLAAALIGIEYTVFATILSLLEARLFRWRRGGLVHAVER